jgi:glycolate oxidase iron-sulfur subunit
VAAFPGTAPVLVDSAGCGAQLKEAAHRLGTADSVAFAARVLDVHEWLAPRIDLLTARSADVVVAVQDPCHLRHVQRAHLPVREVLAPFVTLVELDDEGLCCGAGGAYAAEEPELATAIRDRKLAAIARSGAAVVASANPGCLLHLRAAGVDVRHPCELVDGVLGGR